MPIMTPMQTHPRRLSRCWPLALVLAATASAQYHDGHAAAPPPEAAPDPATTLTAEEIGEHDAVLASDLFEGRESGTRGERRAAAYIISQLETCPRLLPDGPDGEWLQPFDIRLHNRPAVAHNVLARLQGSDPELAGQFIVVGAHYDHVGFGQSGNALDPGVDEIHNGADDNGSGSSVLLDLATSLCGSGWQPRHTILFQWYSGEELGLLGSKHWVEHPTHPLADVIFMVNMDMVGRMMGRTLVVGGTGTSPGLSELARGFCDELHLHMIDDPPGTAPSDNSSFYEAGIPSLFMFTGLHADYHRATDDSAKIDVEGARDVGRLVEDIVRALDARDERPKFQSSPGMAYIFTPRLYLGCAFADAEPPAPAGVRVTVIVPGAPADLAGLREDDYVASLGGQPVEHTTDIDALLEAPHGDIPAMDMIVWRAAPPAAAQAAGAAEVQATSWESVTLHVRPSIR